MVNTGSIQLSTSGDADVKDITAQIKQVVDECEIRNGTVTVFCPSATSALTTIEYESGCVSDLQRLFEEIIPQHNDYAHNAKWHDGNGHSHIRAALLGPSITIPIVESNLTLGTWQQVIYVDFDVRARKRELVVQIIGE